MRVYVLNPPYFPNFGRAMRWQDTGRAGTLYYPIMLSYTTGIIEQDYEARLADAPAWKWGLDDVIKDIEKYQPDVLVMDTSFPSLNNDLSVGEIIKDNYPELKIIVVGPPTHLLADKILQKNIDMVARGEYDLTVKDTIDALDKGYKLKTVNGLSFKKNHDVVHNPDRKLTTSEDLDNFPFVSKVYEKHLNLEDYFLVYSLYPEIQIFTGRGCPQNCTFCSWPQTLTGRKYRVRSIENILDEIEWVEKNLDVKEIFFEDDTFTLDKKRVHEFCEGYKERGLKITWSCNARVDSIDYENMKEMADTNCRFVIVGFESANDEILKNIKKGFTVDEARQFVKDIKKTNLLLHADFIIGLPGETKETIEVTKKFIKDINAEMLQVSVASPFPGTEFYQYAQKNGILITDDPNEYLDGDGHQKSIISYPQLSNDEINREIDQMLRNYYLSFNYIKPAFKQVFRKNSYYEIKRILFSTKMFISYLWRR